MKGRIKKGYMIKNKCDKKFLKKKFEKNPKSHGYYYSMLTVHFLKISNASLRLFGPQALSKNPFFTKQ